MRACSLAVAKAVLDAGVDPILQMTCRDRNRLALQADLLGAGILGIRNVLLLRGDDPKSGDHPEAKPVFDIESAALMQAAKGLADGHDMAGKELSGADAKIKGGAQFFQTQAVFDPAKLAAFMARAKSYGKPILAGILLVKSAKMARYMNEHVWGIQVPEEMIQRFEKAADKRAECVAVTSELIRSVQGSADGIHLYALGWEDLVPAILKESHVPVAA
jgi:5,10-methylenetetrahydrofolate reductase